MTSLTVKLFPPRMPLRNLIALAAVFAVCQIGASRSSYSQQPEKMIVAEIASIGVIHEGGKYDFIPFERNSENIPPSSMWLIDRLMGYMLKNDDDISIRLVGEVAPWEPCESTDAKTCRAAALELGKWRAQAVKNELVSMGISADRIGAGSDGYSSGWTVNRNLSGGVYVLRYKRI